MKVSEYQKLRPCKFESNVKESTIGYTSGTINEGYIEVYTPFGRNLYGEYIWKDVDPIRVPLNRVFFF